MTGEAPSEPHDESAQPEPLINPPEADPNGGKEGATPAEQTVDWKSSKIAKTAEKALDSAMADYQSAKDATKLAAEAETKVWQSLETPPTKRGKTASKKAAKAPRKARR